MGLNKGNKITFLKILNGKIARRTVATDPNAEIWTSKDGKESYYEFYKSVTGLITGIGFKEPPENHKEWSANWLVNMKSGEDIFQLQIPVSSNYALCFFSILPNIDQKYTVEIIPQIKNETWNGVTREKRSLFIRQQGNALSWYYTKANPQGMPEIVKIERKNKKTMYDDDDRNEFFKALMNNFNSELSIPNEAKEDDDFESPDVDEEIPEAENGLPF